MIDVFTLTSVNGFCALAVGANITVAINDKRSVNKPPERVLAFFGGLVQGCKIVFMINNMLALIIIVVFIF